MRYSRLTIIGWGALITNSLILIVTTFFPNYIDYLNVHMFQVFGSTVHDGARWSQGGAATARWHFAAIALNLVSIGCAITLGLLDNDRNTKFEKFVASVLGFLAALTILSLFFVERGIIDFTSVTCIAVTFYALSDMAGMRRLPKNHADHALYWLPFWALDCPMLSALVLIIIAFYFQHGMSPAFYDGAGAGAMIFGALCYTALLIAVIAPGVSRGPREKLVAAAPLPEGRPATARPG